MKNVFYAICAALTYAVMTLWLAPLLKNRPEYREQAPAPSSFDRGAKSTVVPIPEIKGNGEFDDERERMTIKP
jgi:hypothetical protein